VADSSCYTLCKTLEIDLLIAIINIHLLKLCQKFRDIVSCNIVQHSGHLCSLGTCLRCSYLHFSLHPAFLDLLFVVLLSDIIPHAPACIKYITAFCLTLSKPQNVMNQTTPLLHWRSLSTVWHLWRHYGK